ncbi:MAG: CPBP family intramembrane metalloprotease, partial [Phycisphaerae bacterium]|nr:CPBP family intramembrane metalloprotease [Phycisphaerae bacterium]
MTETLLTLLAAPAATTRPETAHDIIVSPMITSLCGIGTWVMLLWLGHGLIKPDKFKLSNSPGRTNELTPIHVVAVLLGSILGMSLLVSVLLLIPAIDKVKLEIIGGLALPTLAAIGGLIVAKYSFANGAVGGMGFTARRWVNDSVRSVIALIAILPVCMILLDITTRLILRYQPDLIVVHPYLDIVCDANAAMFWRVLAVFVAVVAAPIGEELFFRGLMQSMFRRYLARPWLAVICTSVLFAAVHYGVLQSLPALFALAMALGYSYERTGRLYPPIMIHMLFNAIMITDRL